MVAVHRVLLGVLLIGNAIAFAGVDQATRAVTAALVLAMVASSRRLPAVPAMYRWCAVAFAALVVLQLTPLPETLRHLLQPGFAHVLPAGWAPLSLAPWSTVQVAVSVAIAAWIALLATALHEIIGFGLQIPLNRYLAAGWVGVVWGLADRSAGLTERPDVAEEQGAGG